MGTEEGVIAAVKRARAYDPSSAAQPCDQRMIHHPVTARIRDHGECRCREAMRM